MDTKTKPARKARTRKKEGPKRIVENLSKLRAAVHKTQKDGKETSGNGPAQTAKLTPKWGRLCQTLGASAKTILEGFQREEIRKGKTPRIQGRPKAVLGKLETTLPEGSPSLTSQNTVQTLNQTVGPAEFLGDLERIARQELAASPNKSRTLAKLERTKSICTAYLELVEETIESQSQEIAAPGAKPKPWCPETAFWKEMLQNQYSSPAAEGPENVETQTGEPNKTTTTVTENPNPEEGVKTPEEPAGATDGTKPQEEAPIGSQTQPVPENQTAEEPQAAPKPEPKPTNQKEQPKKTPLWKAWWNQVANKRTATWLFAGLAIQAAAIGTIAATKGCQEEPESQERIP
jgi:hypothetical protein